VNLISSKAFPTGELQFKPATLDTWPDFETLFSLLPAPGMCWCMYWRKTRAEWWGHAEENRAAMRALLEAGKVPGILAYVDDVVVGWWPRHGASFRGLTARRLWGS